MKNLLLCLLILIPVFVCSQQNLQLEHRQFLVKENLGSLLQGTHKTSIVDLGNCSKQKLNVSIYIFNNEFSLYTKLNNVILHQKGTLSSELDQCKISLATQILLSSSDNSRGKAVAQCGTCGNLCCYPCTAGSAKSCAVLRFTECSRKACKVTWNRYHFTKDHSWSPLRKRFRDSKIKFNSTISFSLKKTAIAVDEDFAKMEKLPLLLMECASHTYPHIKKNIANNKPQSCITAFIHSQEKLLLFLLGQMVYEVAD